LFKFYDLFICFVGGFGEKGKPAHGDEGVVPPNASLEITRVSFLEDCQM